MRWRPHRDSQRQRRTNRKARGRRQRGLHRMGAQRVGNSQFVAHMRAQGVMLHQFFSNLMRQLGGQPARHLDGSQLGMLCDGMQVKFKACALQPGLFGVALRAHADNTPHTPAASTTRRVIGAHSPVQGPEAAGSDVGDVGEAFEECMVCAMVPGAYLPGPCS